MRIPLNRIAEKASQVAAKTGAREVFDLAELIHDLAEHVREIEDAHLALASSERVKGQG